MEAEEAWTHYKKATQRTLWRVLLNSYYAEQRVTRDPKMFNSDTVLQIIADSCTVPVRRALTEGFDAYRKYADKADNGYSVADCARTVSYAVPKGPVLFETLDVVLTNAEGNQLALKHVSSRSAYAEAQYSLDGSTYVLASSAANAGLQFRLNFALLSAKPQFDRYSFTPAPEAGARLNSSFLYWSGQRQMLASGADDAKPRVLSRSVCFSSADPCPYTVRCRLGNNAISFNL